MPLGIIEVSFRICLNHPLPDDGAFATTVEYLIDVVPSHGMNLLNELMLHFFILIFRLFGEKWQIGGNVPTPYNIISAASDKHVIFPVVDVNHVKDHIFIFCHNHIFFY